MSVRTIDKKKWNCSKKFRKSTEQFEKITHYSENSEQNEYELNCSEKDYEKLGTN